MQYLFRGLMLLMPLFAVLLCSCTRTEVPDAATDPPVEKSSDPVASPEQSLSRDEIRAKHKVVHRVRGGEPGPDGWCLANATRGNFTVMLPGQFQDVMVTAPSVTGGTGIMHSVAAFNAAGVEFTVLQSEIRGERPEGSQADVIIDRFNELGANLTQTNVAVAGQPAVRLHVEARGVVADMIFISMANNDYMLAVQQRAPDADGSVFATDAERFFKSFKINNEGE